MIQLSSRAEEWCRSSRSAAELGSSLASPGQDGTRTSLLLLEADLCMVMQKMMHSQFVVSAVGQDGARTLRLQSKRILTAMSQSPCLFIIAASLDDCHRTVRPRSRRPLCRSVSLSLRSTPVGLSRVALAPCALPSPWPRRRPPGSMLSSAN